MLERERERETLENLIVDMISATLSRAKPAASSLQAVPGNNKRTDGSSAETEEPCSDSGLQH